MKHSVSSFGKHFVIPVAAVHFCPVKGKDQNGEPPSEGFDCESYSSAKCPHKQHLTPCKSYVKNKLGHK